MRALSTLCVSGIFAVWASNANAGAWTLAEDNAQIISSVTATRASRGFDDRARPDVPIRFDKLYTQLYGEYGLTDDLTLIAAPEFEIAKWQSPGSSASGEHNFAFAGGARYRIFDTFGVGAVQLMAKSAGAFDVTTNSGGAEGQQYEVRLLYGTNFDLWNCDGFADIEAGQRWILGPRPDETPVDLTVGFHALPFLMLMIQSFNIVSMSNGKPPYGYYRSHKLQLSAVADLGHGFSVQLGGLYAPAGQNSLQEEGVVAALWARF